MAGINKLAVGLTNDSTKMKRKNQNILTHPDSFRAEKKLNKKVETSDYYKNGATPKSLTSREKQTI